MVNNNIASSSNASGENVTNNVNESTVSLNATETQAIDEDKILEISENKFTISTIDEDEIIEKIEEKTKLDKDKIKRAIKFKKKEPVKEEYELEEFEPSVVQLGYITKVNGSVIIRLG